MTEKRGMEPAARRRLMHQRTVVCDGYLRGDGLWEVEARLRDTKTFAYSHFARGALEPGEAVHDMTLRLTVDDALTIVGVDAEMATTPVLTCQDVLPGMRALIGIRLVAGWRKIARERIGRLESCTHLMDLMVPATTTFYQTVGMGKHPEGRNAVNEAGEGGVRPFYLDGCYSWRIDGPVVREFLPVFAEDRPAED